jgi:FkbM family methyltransferase
MTKFFLRAFNKLNLLDKFNLTGKIVLNEKVFRIPVLGRTGFLNMWMTEPWMIDLLKIVLPLSKGVFIDVGVNSGQTLLKLKSVSGDIEYIGFEPNPTCIHYVNELIKTNQFKNVVLIPAGISTTSQITKLFFFDKSDMDSSASIIEDFRPDHTIEKTEFIPVYNMAAVKQSIDTGKIGIIKIDVEGGESEVLSSMKDEITLNQPIILLEILPAYKEDNFIRIQRQDEIQQLFKDLNYSVFRVIKENEQLVQVKAIAEIGIHGDLNSCEYVAVPKRLQEEFLQSSQQKLSSAGASV